MEVACCGDSLYRARCRGGEKHRIITTVDGPSAPVPRPRALGPTASRHRRLPVAGRLIACQPGRPHSAGDVLALHTRGYATIAARSSTRQCTTPLPSPHATRHARLAPRTLVSERLTDTEHCFVAVDYVATDVLAAKRATRRGRDARALPRRPPVRRRIFGGFLGRCGGF